MNDQKILWFDVETGGTEPKTDALLQLASIIEVNNEVVDELEMKIQPIKGKFIWKEAVEKHGFTPEIAKGFDDPEDCFDRFEKLLLKHNPRPSKTGRYIMAGYNPDFDCKFLHQWYEFISGNPYAYWKHLQFSPIDALPVLRAMRYAGILDIPNTKLETVCKKLNIPINAHDALSDIRATRTLTKRVYEKLFHNIKGGPYGLTGKLNNN